ncbi:hypothetical protein [Cronobacter sakazakii]|uniref:hypothetical protein n=1 Tax=Cronobacter sakazakii TaxID=28141 RepID=UPI001EFE2C48|nr:hypothetical protein [Cronobacter sakazakii]
MHITEKITEAKNFLEAAAFQVSSGRELPEAHRNIVKALVSLEELERMFAKDTTPVQDELQEAFKVARRLKLWAKRPEQMNTRILKAFLKLSDGTDRKVSEAQLKQEVGEDNFDINFVQMKNIAEKNHGKVFDVNGSEVSIWPPVAAAVEEFRRTVFSK